jgi:hypothetical protein
VASGLTLVSWVAAFGLPGRLIGRLPSRLGPLAAPAGCLILGAAYLGISLSLFAGHHAGGLLVALLASVVSASGPRSARSSATSPPP